MKPWYQKRAKRKSEDETGYLIQKLDKIFSEFIRLRDSDNNGIIKCITSGKFMHWTEADCGHFMSRQHMSTRFHEQNCNAQGPGDNRFQSGKQFEHGLAIDKKFGAGTAAKLHLESKFEMKYTAHELTAMISYYKAEVKKAERRKV
jgi:hypothetical protein